MIICSTFAKLATMKYMGIVEIKKKSRDANSMKKEIRFRGADSPPYSRGRPALPGTGAGAPKNARHVRVSGVVL